MRMDDAISRSLISVTKHSYPPQSSGNWKRSCLGGRKLTRHSVSSAWQILCTKETCQRQCDGSWNTQTRKRGA
jgi:hypothetical protein